MIQITSQLSLLETIKEKKINKRQQQILDCLKKYTRLNNRQISFYAGMAINVTTARCNELVKLGKITEDKKAHDPITKRLTIFWKLA